MAERVATGEVFIGLNDQEVEAGLRKIEAQFERTMSRIEREKAVANITADLAGLDEKVAQARRKLEKWEGEKATATLDADKRKADTEIKKATTSLKRLDGERATIEVKLRGAERAAAELRALEKYDRDIEAANAERVRRTDAIVARSARAEESRAREAMQRERDMAHERVSVTRSSLNEEESLIKASMTRRAAAARKGDTTGTVELDMSPAARTEREFERSLAKVEREQHVASVRLDMSEADDAVANLKRNLRELKGSLAELKAANPDVELDDEQFEAESAGIIAAIKAVHTELDRVDGDRATLEIRLKGAEQALAAEMALQKASEDTERAYERRAAAMKKIDDDEARAEQKARDDNWKAVQSDAQRRARLHRQEVSEHAAAERVAYQLDRERDRQIHAIGVGIDNEAAKAIQLQKQYSKLTDQLERIARKRPIGREARAKVELDAAGVITKMEALKKQLNFMGAHPPVDIKADVDRKGVVNRMRGVLSDVGTTLGGKLASLQDMTVRVGPFTTTIKQLGIALSFLGPTVMDLVGALGSLVGVVGTGLAGAFSLAAGGVVGFGGVLAGMMFSTRNTRQELKQARTSINAYQTALMKFGPASDKTKKKQDEMNHVLKSISPLAREAAKGTEEFFRGWDRSTKPTQNSLGQIAKDGFAALNQMRPMWAARTNEFSDILQRNLSSGFKWLGGPGSRVLDDIMGNFNKNLPSLMRGFGNLGRSLLNFAREGSRNLSVLTGGWERMTGKLLAFTQRDSFGATVKRWVSDARDLMRFFGAAGRVMMHFFGAGSKAGAGFVRDMTAAMNRWDKFLTSTQGQDRVGAGFERSVKGAEALWHAIAPLAGAFVIWANSLSPFVAGVLNGISIVSRLVGWITNLVGMRGALATFGATFGAIWTVAKMGTVISMMARAVKLMRELGAMKTIGAVFSGSFFKQLKSGGIVQAGTIAAGEMRTAIIAGGTVAAAEMRAAMAQGGAAGALPGMLGRGRVGTATSTLGRTALPAAEVAGGAAAAEGAAAAAGSAGLGGLTLATGGAALAVVALGAGIAILIARHKKQKTEVEKLNDKLTENARDINFSREAQVTYGKAQDKSVSSTRAARAEIERLKGALKGSKDGTLAQRDLELQLFDARTKLKNVTEDRVGAANKDRRAASEEISQARRQISLIKERTDAKLREIEKNKPKGTALIPEASERDRAEYQRKLDAAIIEGATSAARAQRMLTQALNRRAAASLNVARAERNMSALTGKPAQQAGALARERPQLAQTIALKYKLPTDAGNVSAAARRALGQGVTLKTVLKIIADSKDADAALKRLRSEEVDRKMVRFGISGDHGVLSKLSEIDRKAIKRKIARIIEHGGQPTLSMINQIIQKQIRDKRFAVRAAVSDAIAQIDLMASHLSRIQSKSITVSATRIGNGWNAVEAKRGRAAGRSTGQSEHSLVGEGRAPEWRVNTQDGTATKIHDPMVMALKPSDYIIPTEPRFRSRGRQFFREASDSLPESARDALSMIAKDLGIPAFKGGRKPSKAQKKIQHQGQRKVGGPGQGSPDSEAVAARGAVRPIPMPEIFKAAGVPEEVVTNEATKAHTAVQTREGQIQTAHASLTRAQATYRDAEKRVREWKRPKGKAGKNAKKPTIPAQTERGLRDAEQRYTALRKGGLLPGQTNPIVSLDYLKTADKELNDALAKIHTANKILDSLKTRIDTEYTYMSNASAKYGRTGDRSFYDDFTEHRDTRSGLIKEYLGKLNAAKGVAQTLAKKYKNSDFSTLNDTLAGTIAATEGDQASNDVEVPEPPTAPDFGAEAFVERLDPALSRELYGLNEAASLASTTDTLSDDKSAADALESFWARILGSAQSLNEDPRVIGAVADAWAAARDNAKGITEAINAPPSLDDLVKGYGLEGTLAAANRDVAQAAVDNVPDDPNTPQREDIAALTDDLAAAANVKEFYKGVMDRAISEGRPDATVTEAITAFTGARDTWQGIQSQINDQAQVEAQQKYSDFMSFGTAREDLYKSFASNFRAMPGMGTGSVREGGAMGFNPVSMTPTTPAVSSIFGGMSRANSVLSSPSAPGSPMAAPAAAPTAGGDTHITNVDLSPRFTEQPKDPHTWSKGVAFELQAAL